MPLTCQIEPNLKKLISFTVVGQRSDTRPDGPWSIVTNCCFFFFKLYFKTIPLLAALCVAGETGATA